MGGARTFPGCGVRRICVMGQEQCYFAAVFASDRVAQKAVIGHLTKAESSSIANCDRALKRARRGGVGGTKYRGVFVRYMGEKDTQPIGEPQAFDDGGRITVTRKSLIISSEAKPSTKSILQKAGLGQLAEELSQAKAKVEEAHAPKDSVVHSTSAEL